MTIIATSLDITHPRKQSIMKRRDELLESVKSVMISETFDDNMSIETLLATAGVNEEEYYEALKIAKKGNVVVLKRSPKEIWINNYNEEWLTAWNGNLDLQICIASNTPDIEKKFPELLQPFSQTIISILPIDS